MVIEKRECMVDCYDPTRYGSGGAVLSSCMRHPDFKWERRTFPGFIIRKSRAGPASALDGSYFLRAKIFVAEQFSLQNIKRHFSLTSSFPSSATSPLIYSPFSSLDTMSDKISQKDKQLWGMPVR